MFSLRGADINEVIIDEKQAHNLAMLMYAMDILTYIQDYKAEYDVFTAVKKLNDVEEDIEEQARKGRAANKNKKFERF